jgi:hypothetical protein
MGIGWPTEAPAFDPPSDFSDLEICQLMPTLDGFPVEEPCRFESDRDPPKYEECIDSPHLEDNVDPPHWVDTNCIIYN